MCGFVWETCPKNANNAQQGILHFFFFNFGVLSGLFMAFQDLGLISMMIGHAFTQAYSMLRLSKVECLVYAILSFHLEYTIDLNAATPPLG